MENYRIYFDESERNEVIRILRSHNDVVIDNIDANSVGITIEKDDNEGVFYKELLEEIDRNVFSVRTDSGI
jgi:hypothetical protein